MNVYYTPKMLGPPQARCSTSTTTPCASVCVSTILTVPVVGGHPRASHVGATRASRPAGRESPRRLG